MDFFDRMILAEKDAAEWFEPGALHADFVPIVGGLATHGVWLANGLDSGAGFPAETLEVGEGENAFDFELVNLLEAIPVFEELGGEIAVVGHEDEASGGVFEIADGINALGKAAQKIAEGFAALGIGEGGDDFRRLVEDEIDEALGGFDSAAGGFDFVFGRIGFGAEFGDDFAVDADLAGEDELFGVAARGDAGAGNDFLEAFEHEESSVSVVRFGLGMRSGGDSTTDGE